MVRCCNMNNKITGLKEEIARWAFEIRIKNRKSDWKIAFTNPTAGPWKTIKFFDDAGTLGEVYRYPLTEERPDILLVNDKLKLVLIIEAKDSMPKLVIDTQVKKSVKVVSLLTKTLKELGGNRFWGARSSYKVIVGLLWGTTEASISATSRTLLFETYRSKLTKYKDIDSTYIVGIESVYANDEIKCKIYIDEKPEGSSSLKSLIAESFSGLDD